MRALIVATEHERLQALRAPLDAADTECVVVDSWSAANPILVQSPRPSLVVVTLDQLVHDGLNSLLAADAQLKVLRIPTVLVHDEDQARDIQAVRALVNFGAIQALPADDGALTRAYNGLVPGVAAITPRAEPLQSFVGDPMAAGDSTAVWFQSNEPALAVGTCVDRRYEIEQLIETGGMGQIYRARQLPLGRPVALKVIRSDLAREAEALARFRLEAETVSRLHHPNTITLYDYGIDQAPYPGRDDAGLMYLAMEWLEGQTLEQALERSHQLPPGRVVHIAHQVAQSLAEAHDKGIVHRDLKPSNIFVLSGGDRVKVLDFGIAKLVDTPEAKAITRVGAICGTPEYMSPEQARGEDLDGRSDIYSLGCVMYAALAGEPPFVHEQALNVIIAHQTMEPAPLPEGVPESLRRVVMRCLAKKPHARLPTAVELVAILERIDDGDEAGALALLDADDRKSQTETVAVRPAQKPNTSASGVHDTSEARRQTSPSMSSGSAQDLLDDAEADAFDALLGGLDDDADDLLGANDHEFELLDPFALDGGSGGGRPASAGGAELLDSDDELLTGDLLDDEPEPHDEDALDADDAECLVIDVPSLDVVQLSETSIARWLHLASRQRLSGTVIVSRNRLVQRAELRDGQVVRPPGGRLEPLLATFAWSDGELELQRGAAGAGEAVETLGLLYEGIRLHVSVNQVAADLARDHARYPIVTSHYLEHQSAYDALEGVQTLISACDGTSPLGTVMMSTGLGFETVCRALALTLTTDAVHLAASPTQVRPTVVYRGGDDASTSHTHAEALSVADRLLLEQLERFLQDFRGGDHHTALGLQPGCGVDAVHTRYTKFTRDYAETRLRRKPAAIKALSEPLHREAKLALQALIEAESAMSLDSGEHAVVERLERILARFRGADPYAAFGLEPGCGSDRVDDAYFQLVNEHHPDHFASYGRAEIKRAANEVFIALQETYQRLLASEPERGPTPVRPTTRAARPVTSSARPVTSPARPVTSSARPVSSPARPVSSPARPVTSSSSPSRPASATQRPASPPATSSPSRDARTSGSNAQASRYRIAPPSRPTSPTRTSQSTPTVSRPSVPRAAPTSRTTSGRPATAPSRDAAGADASAASSTGAPRQRKMSEILAERAAARQATAASTTAAASPPSSTPDARVVAQAPPAPDLSWRELFRRGERHLERQQHSSALQCFERAAESEPENGEVAAYLAWTRYVCDPSTASDTETLLKAARKSREGYVAATFFLGKLAAQRQDLEAARGLFEATLSKNARHIGAQRELRLVKMRLEEDGGGLFGKLKRKLTRRDG